MTKSRFMQIAVASASVLIIVGAALMAFCVHLNNWGEVTLNAENTTFKSTYMGVRVFNSGYDMNNVAFNDCDFITTNHCFWVHNYVSADFGASGLMTACRAVTIRSWRVRLTLLYR